MLLLLLLLLQCALPLLPHAWLVHAFGLLFFCRTPDVAAAAAACCSSHVITGLTGFALLVLLCL
jgi:hypothetical protein